MTRFRTLAAILLAITLLAAACGEDDADTTAVGDDSTTDDTGDELPVNDGEPDGEPDGDSDDEPTLEPGDEPLGAGPYPIADITFEVDAGDGTTTYRLACLGDTATFTGDTALSADQACLALNDLDVRTRLLTDDHLDRMCTEQYGGPQIATVTGTLDDEPVDATIDRANGCGIDDWDRLLTAVLPPAT